MPKRELSPEYLKKHYIDLNKTRYQISKETGVSSARIGSLLQQYGIKRYSIERHGLSAHPLNIIWCGIKERCQNPNADNYKWYGGKGVKLCDEWQEFLPFYNWAISHNWEHGLTVDRIDGDGDYSPDNCRLITIKQQCRNRKTNKSITIDGVTHLQCEWEETLGLSKKIIAKWRYRHDVDYIVSRLRSIIKEKGLNVS